MRGVQGVWRKIFNAKIKDFIRKNYVENKMKLETRIKADTAAISVIFLCYSYGLYVQVNIKIDDAHI